MESKKKSVPETPFSRAKKVWDDRIGNSERQSKNWRIIALISLIVAVLSLVGVLFLAKKSTVETFVVSVDNKTGEVLNIKNLEKKYEPRKQEYQFYLADFIRLIRTISSDEQIVNQNWERAFKFLTKKGAKKLLDYLKKNNPIDVVGDITVSVKIEAVNFITEKSLQVDWQEKVFNIKNGNSETKKFTGVFTLKHLPVTEKTDLLVNPLGIYIDDMSWSEKR